MVRLRAVGQYAWEVGKRHMKYTLERIPGGEDEVILRYRRMTPEVERLWNLINKGQAKLIGWKEKTRIMIDAEMVLYIESVDGRTFAYTDEEVFAMDETLNKLGSVLSSINFFRCSKSMIINIDKVQSLKSLPSNRIDAAMCNGEHIMISRTYASDFRRRLKGGREDE